MEENSMNTAPQPKNEDFTKQLIEAIIHLGYRLAYFLFILPFGLWKNAVIRMSSQKENHTLDVTGIKSEFPFLSWLKRFTFDFLIDGLTVIIWLVGLILFFVTNGSNLSDMGFFPVLIALYMIYWAPASLAIFRDCLTLFVVMPVRWLISYFRRPAKTYDLTHTGSIKQ